MSARKRIAALLPLILVVTLTTVVRTAGPAAAAGPSFGLEQTASVAVTPVGMTGRPADEASRLALHGNQPAGGGGGPAGGGNPSASPLAAAATWQVSPNTGDFTWSYPLRVPPVPGGTAPGLALSYASSAVDGRSSATNNQASWVGDGWDLSVGFIERAYQPCKQGPDLCWRNDNATAAFGGGGRLIHESGDTWRAETDDGSRIERFLNAGNGDDNGEHWKITKVDGTQYFFGSRPEASSTWTVPVRGDDAGEPCAGGRCTQAWRWNLDKVVDPHGNAILYGYDIETNSYGEPAVSYVRAGHLRSAEYGPVLDGKRGARVDFLTEDRCVPGSDCRPELKANWPDVPWDDKCDTGSCPGKLWPSFWDTKRLSSVRTSVLAGGEYRTVDSWTLAHTYPYAGDDASRAALWLRSITHTGHVGGEIQLPEVTFEGIRKPNRVVLPDNFTPLNRYRISAVVSETGGVTEATYRDPDCTAASLPTEPEHNGRLCYPVKWQPPGSAKERTDYFLKYAVAEVKQLDRFGSGVAGLTRYEYLDGAAWHYDTSEFTEDTKRTWNEFRGFGRVRVRTGDDGDQSGPVTMTESRYHRGMDDDTLPGGGHRSVSIDDGEGGVRPDHKWLAGFGYYAATHLGDSATIVAKTLTTPVWRGPAASRGSIVSYQVRTGATRELTTLAAGGRRETKVVTSYDDRGLADAATDYGDVADDGDDLATTTRYDRNTGAWILNLPSQIETRAGDTLVSGTRTSYDGRPFGAPPIRGDATLAEAAEAPGVYRQQSRAEFDTYGRATKSYDALDRTTSTVYEPADGPLTRTTVTNPLGHAVVTTFEPAWGTAVKTVDQNNRTSEIRYDALGRVAESWLPNRLRADNPRGDHRFDYLLRNDGPSVVTSTKIGPTGNYVSGKAVYDGLLRVRETQDTAAGGGRLITETRYDTFGRGYQRIGPYFNDAPVDDELWTVHDGTAPAVATTSYDGAGREVKTTLTAVGSPAKQTTTWYGGDRVTVTPPPGAPRATTVTDARGQAVERIQAGLSTRYGYTLAGQLASITDPAGNTWRFSYDLLGRKVRTEDVDRGTSTATYDAAGQLTSLKDAGGTTLDAEYDPLGRRTAVRSGGKLLSEWTYDKKGVPNGVGMPATATRHQGGHAYVTRVLGYSALGQPTRTEVVIPEAEQTLAGTYQSILQYNVDGSLRTEILPAAGDLKQEAISHDYDDYGRATTTTSGAVGSVVSYVAQTEFTRYGEPSRLQLGSGTKRVWMSAYREQGTRRLDRLVVDAEAPAPLQSDTSYDYDPAGNLTSVATDVPGQSLDRQCFAYDELTRLAEAWTPAATCAEAPDADRLGGPAPYRQKFSYDAAGNRTGDLERTYAYATGHRLASVTKGSKVATYAYDATGNTVDRAGQKLEWDELGDLAKAGATSFVTTADGARLLRKDAGGATLYLTGQEIRLDHATGERKGTRYYTHGGKTIAVRANGRLTWTPSDHQNSVTLAIDADSLVVSRRRFDPFGAPRGPGATFPSDRGFVGGTVDASTGLTHLGARDYDPLLGRFVSVDPLLLPNDPLQANGYAYAGNNPVTFSDPSGLAAASCPDGECKFGGWAPGTSPASTFDGVFRPPVTWSNPPAQAPDGECRFCGRGYNQSPAATFRRAIPAREPYIPGRCPDNECSAATKADWGKHQQWAAYQNRERGIAQAMEATKAEVAAREQAAQCGFWCGAGNLISDVVNSDAFGLVGTVLGVLTPICPVCGMVSLGMAVLSAAVTCAGGIGVSCGMAIAGAALGAVSLGAGRLAARAGDRMLVDIGSDAVNVSVGGMRLTGVGYDAAGVVVNRIRGIVIGDVLQAGTHNSFRGLVIGNVWQIGPNNSIRGLVIGKVTRINQPGG